MVIPQQTDRYTKNIYRDRETDSTMSMVIPLQTHNYTDRQTDSDMVIKATDRHNKLGGKYGQTDKLFVLVTEQRHKLVKNIARSINSLIAG